MSTLTRVGYRSIVSGYFLSREMSINNITHRQNNTRQKLYDTIAMKKNILNNTTPPLVFLVKIIVDTYIKSLGRMRVK